MADTMRTPETRPAGLVSRIITAWALLGGVLLLALVLMNTWSIIGNQFGRPFPGDFELTEIGVAIAAFAFLPYCQISGANVTADIFTSRLGRRWLGVIEMIASATALLFAALLGWRMHASMLDQWSYDYKTAILAFPIWLAYVPILISMALLVTAGFASFRSGERDAASGFPDRVVLAARGAAYAAFAGAALVVLIDIARVIDVAGALNMVGRGGGGLASALSVGFVGLLVLVALIGFRMPIAYAMILVGGVGVSVLNGPAVFFSQLKTLAYGQFSIYDLSVVPMFVLMGNISTKAGLSRALFRAASVWLGWMRGGVAMSAIAACAGFGAVCGSSLATASTMGQVALPELKRYRYSPALATGTLAAGGVLGILIPPSVVLVIYAVIVEANIVTMFMAALIPGIIAVILFLITIAIYVRIRPEAGPAGPRAGREEFVAATLGLIPVAGVFGLVIGGIYFGWFNPTPAAAIGVMLVWLYGAVRGNVRWAQMRDALLSTAQTTGMIYLILLGAEMLKIFMSRGGVPQAVAEWMANSGQAPMTILILLLAALIFLGMLMDSLSMILLAVPFFWPVLVEINGGDYVDAASAGFGMNMEELKVWFGILALIVVELGLITPPVGMNVFVISALARGVPMRQTFLGVMPFFAAELVRVAILVAFPVLTLWLPRALAG